jgi:hypothetical protein
LSLVSMVPLLARSRPATIEQGALPQPDAEQADELASHGV